MLRQLFLSLLGRPSTVRNTSIRRRLRPQAEILEDRLHPAVTAAVVGTTLDITGDAANNTATVRLVSGNPTETEVLSGSSSVGTFSNVTFTSISASLGNGTDNLIVDSRNGNPIPVGGISYNGGTGSNTFAGPNWTAPLFGGADVSQGTA